MKDIFAQLLKIGIIVSLSDKEAFIQKVTRLIEQYEQDPEKAEKWAQSLMEYLKDKRAGINLESSIKNAVYEFDLPNSENVEELTKAIKELTLELQQLKAKR